MAAAKVTTVTDNEITETEVELPEVEESTTETENTPTEQEKALELISAHPILEDFTSQYLSIFEEISKYNQEVLATRDSEWNVGKVVAKAHELAKPAPNSGIKADDEIAALLKTYEEMMIALAKAKQDVVAATSKKLGISLSATAERDPLKEEALKEKRTKAIVLGKQLHDIGTMLSNEEIAAAIKSFLGSYPLPAVGRQSATSFGDSNSGKGTPKYRVKVTVKRGDTVIEEFDGFTKAGASLSNPKFGYARGADRPTAEKFRTVWEAAGNNAEKTVQSTVEFTDNDLTFILVKK